MTDYIMPFLIIIAVGVIIVLVFNLFKAMFFNETTGDAFLHLESGSVQIKAFGTDSYLDLSSDALVMQGDELKTSADGKAIIEFFDGTIMRLDGGSDVIIEQIDDGDDPYINIMLVDGKLWFNKFYNSSGDTAIEIAMTNLVVKSSSAAVFEVENEFDEIVRVIRDEVLVDILGKDGSNVVESETVGVNQEMIFTDKVLETYWLFQSPTVLSGISDDFEETRWFEWNTEEDKDPTPFSKSAILGGDEYVEVAPEVIDPEPEVDGEEAEVADDDLDMEPVVEEEEVEEEIEEELVEEEPVEEEPVEEEPVGDLGPLGTPTVTSVAGVTETNADGFYVVTSNPATLTGGISGAEDVVVSGYTLKQFAAGDSTWTYYANADYALMEEGENSYEVYALAPDGTKSESITVKVLYQPPAPVVEEPPAEEPVEEEPQTAQDPVE